jgi:hypothetical protein
VDDLLDFVHTKELAWNPNVVKDTISLINVFPRRVYTHNDGSLDMKSAGFLPNVSLNVNIAVPEAPISVVEEEPMITEQEQDTDMREPSDPEEDEEDEDEVMDTQVCIAVFEEESTKA